MTRVQWSTGVGKICAGCNMVLHTECIAGAIPSEPGASGVAASAAATVAPSAGTASADGRAQWFCPFVPLCRALGSVCRATPPRRLVAQQRGEGSDPPVAPRDGAPFIPVEGLHEAAPVSADATAATAVSAEGDAQHHAALQPFAADAAVLRAQALALTEPRPVVAPRRARRRKR